MKLADLFDIKNGHGLDLANIEQSATWGEGVAYVSCADRDNGVTGWVKPIEGKTPASAGTISVALTGSVLSAFVQVQPYYTASHMAILTPKTPMSLAEQFWWVSCIRANRYRFNYGRKADRTIRDLELPERVPEWVTDAKVRDAVLDLAEAVPNFEQEVSPRPRDRVTTIGDLFSIQRGHKLDLVDLIQVEPLDGIAYVSRSEKSNGVVAWVKEIEGLEPAAAGTISVALGGNSVMAAYVQPTPYYTAQNVDVLTPIDPAMSLPEKLWWTSCILVNRYRYNYGRHANRTFRSLALPSEMPEWAGLIPHDSSAALRESLFRVADSVDESEFENFKDAMETILKVSKPKG